MCEKINIQTNKKHQFINDSMLFNFCFINECWEWGRSNVNAF